MPNLMAAVSWQTVGLERLCLQYGVDGTTMCRSADLSVGEASRLTPKRITISRTGEN